MIPGGNVKLGVLCNKSWPAELVHTEGALIFQSPQTLAFEDSVPGTSLYISDLLALRRQLGEDQTASRLSSLIQRKQAALSAYSEPGLSPLD